MDKCQVVFLPAAKARGSEAVSPVLPAAFNDGVMVFPKERRKARVYDFRRSAEQDAANGEAPDAGG